MPVGLIASFFKVRCIRPEYRKRILVGVSNSQSRLTAFDRVLAFLDDIARRPTAYDCDRGVVVASHFSLTNQGQQRVIILSGTSSPHCETSDCSGGQM
jgi:hypothetical protein